jgi:hypothetical protein
MTAARRLYDAADYAPITAHIPDPTDGVQFLGRHLEPVQSAGGMCADG